MKVFLSAFFLSVFLLNGLKVFAQGGTIDNSFNLGSGFNEYVVSIAVQPDDKIVAGGFFTSFNGSTANRLIRLNGDGTQDTTFNIGSGFDTVYVSDVALQSNGKLIVRGTFSSFNGVPCNRIIRLHSNGSLDTTFSLDSANCENTYVIKVQADDKLICSGFYLVNGQTVRAIRLNENGTLDSSFVLDTALVNADIGCMELQPDGKILIGGQFVINGAEASGILRLNSDGSLDQTFQANVAFAVQRITYNEFSQKIDIYGEDVPFPGPYRLLQLNLDGTVDLNFTGEVSNTGFNLMADQPDGKLIVTGSFINYQGAYRQGIVRLNTNGTVDQSFFPKMRLAFPFDLDFQSDGKIVFGGGNLYWPDPFIDYMLRLSACSTFSFDEAYTCDTFCEYNGVNYYSPGVHNQYLTNSAGCDSVVQIYIGFDQYRPTVLTNIFAGTDINGLCTGTLNYMVKGNSPFHAQLDTNSWEALSNLTNINAYGNMDSLCSGLYELRIAGVCGDTLSTYAVIPSVSNSIVTNQYGGSQVTDTLGAVVEDCSIDYNSIDTMYVESVWITNADTCVVVWNIHDVNGTHYDTIAFNYYLQPSSLVLFQLSLYCPNKNSPLYFTGTHVVYVDQVETASIDEKSDLFEVLLFPNPTKDNLSVSFSEPHLELQILDLQGHVIEIHTLVTGQTVSLSSFESGLYFFKFRTAANEMTKRVVKL
ncbi:MAG: hypothetical protein K0S23_2512 [Fluviicola sp.]|jgi:uncharacterized delta-60 repeat protein|uniref:T9SS type A sorting domain-containing protein n=1 Tax=Fluviicola sp. TaxID=1917219 RepID=UPI0026215BE6|nr:T9SS type A sorting domain-containing protein [Fluviicola sp.]MDF3028205.1 hypothetical protein [Fluviicola sp.]